MNTPEHIPRTRQLGTPGRLALAVVVAVVGLTASLAWAAVGLADQTLRPAEMVTTTIPGSVSLEISRPGAHVVYLESAVPTEVRDLDPALGLSASDLRVTDAAGAPVEVEPYTRDLRYDAASGGSGTVGQAIAVFHARGPGSYLVATSSQLSDPTAKIAVGDDLAPGVLRALLLPAIAGVVSVTLAIVLAAGVLNRSSRQHSTPTSTGGAL